MHPSFGPSNLTLAWLFLRLSFVSGSHNGDSRLSQREDNGDTLGRPEATSFLLISTYDNSCCADPSDATPEAQLPNLYKLSTDYGITVVHFYSVYSYKCKSNESLKIIFFSLIFLLILGIFIS